MISQTRWLRRPLSQGGLSTIGNLSSTTSYVAPNCVRKIHKLKVRPSAHFLQR